MREISSTSQTQPQSTARILMIRPSFFGFNQETAATNKFQKKGFDTNSADIQEKAKQEFELFAEQLKSMGIDLHLFDESSPGQPDALFSNNWISFHQSGKVVLYPMMAENRRLERRMDIINALAQHYHVDEIIDLSYFEKENKFLEGTGSVVLDRRYKIAYACISKRTHLEVLEKLAELIGYEIVAFHGHDTNGEEIYHTNVMMCVGDIFAVVCLEAVKDTDERLKLRSILEQTNKYIIEISLEQLQGFTGNILLVRNMAQEKFLVMSTTAYETFTPKQRAILSDYAVLIHSDLQTIEKYGGGSARCMMTEMHLPKS